MKIITLDSSANPYLSGEYRASNEQEPERIYWCIRNAGPTNTYPIRMAMYTLINIDILRKVVKG